MKKSTLRGLLHQAREDANRLRARETARHAEANQRLQMALNDLRGPAEVLVITPSGHRVQAKVIRVEWDQDQINVGTSFDPNQYMPGMQSVEIRIVPTPG